MTNPEPVWGLMLRTMYNLEYIEERATPDGPYEVTQLVNSFLGALAHPWERLKRELNSMTLDEAEACGWPRLIKERPEDKEPKSLGDLLRQTRNGFAHGHVEFTASGPDIDSIHFWNEDPRQEGPSKRTWGTVLTVQELRRFLSCFVALADELRLAKAARAGEVNRSQLPYRAR